MERVHGNAVACLRATFDEHELITIDNGQQPLWLALQVAEALGYTEPSNLGTMIRGKWSDDLTEGTDFRVATKAELDALKAVGAIGKNTPSLMLLTESGVFAVALLSRKPAAVRLRQWLSREVLPQIRATGRYEVSPSEAGPMVDEDAVSAPVSAPVGASTYVLVIGRRGMVFGSGLTIREAEMDTLTTLRRIMADDEDVDLSILLKNMATLTVAGDNVDAFMYEQSQQSEQREND